MCGGGVKAVRQGQSFMAGLMRNRKHNEMKAGEYTGSLTNYRRRMTGVVHVGNMPMGSTFPIRLQSMANTDTCRIADSVSQCIRLAEAGAHYVRFAVPSVREASCLKQIRQKLMEAGRDNPLIADVHFNADIAALAAGVVEKVRINPGNYGKTGIRNGEDSSESGEGDTFKQVQSEFKKLLSLCRSNRVALRIGVNHGSLASRIIRRYGDTPEGMAESAMEFLRVCRHANFDQVVVSMKSSNILVMVQATRLVVSKMKSENMSYPVHLGVTEAGEGEDGRIKSAAGMGVLLADGIGDTIRVSLTEDPVAEVIMAKKLMNHIEDIKLHERLPELDRYFVDPYEQHKRPVSSAAYTGGKNIPLVIGAVASGITVTEEHLADFGWHYSRKNDSWTFDERSADYVFVRKAALKNRLPSPKGIIVPVEEWNRSKSGYIRPLLNAGQYLEDKELPDDLHFVAAGPEDLKDRFIKKIKADPAAVLIYKCSNKNANAELRVVFARLHNADCRVPVIIRNEYHEDDLEAFQVKSAADTGGTFIDGLGNGLWLSNLGNIHNSDIISTAFGILQACRMRISRTEYIACPSCGRTHFDIMRTLAEIKKRTSHLKGLKIGVMGCIVNGPGEMADADYGYVGSGKGKITLYRSKEVIRRGIPEEKAVDELISLIKENGDWVDRDDVV
ncbi:MAG: (E)-4-hydroxy-3-methylbut-2-enyl-diphosphate synthase [Bacteroidales bacterium]|nr:(E)-4-hydroxy-3-methylbut-2-enyl-diphosphate synthase [Bacteroidales bacterium]